MEDPAVQKMVLQQAKKGLLPAPILQMLFYYAYGKPVEHIETSGPNGGPIPFADLTKLTPAERQARIVDLGLRRAG